MTVLPPLSLTENRRNVNLVDAAPDSPTLKMSSSETSAASVLRGATFQNIELLVVNTARRTSNRAMQFEELNVLGRNAVQFTDVSKARVAYIYSPYYRMCLFS
jgi:hypothetical protein